MQYVLYGLAFIGAIVLFIVGLTFWGLQAWPWLVNRWRYGSRGYGTDDNWMYRRLRRRAEDVSVWCGGEFPILGDVGDWLYSQEHNDISSFREELRRKYRTPESGAAGGATGGEA